MSAADKLPTLPMRTLPGVLEAAGRAAYGDGYPWTSAYGYAAAIVGTSDCVAVWVAASRYLRGWVDACNEDGKVTLPKWLRELPDLPVEGVR